MTWVTFKKDIEQDGKVIYRKGYQADVSGNAMRAHLAKDEVLVGKHVFDEPKVVEGAPDPVDAEPEEIEIPTVSRKRPRSR